MQFDNKVEYQLHQFAAPIALNDFDILACPAKALAANAVTMPTDAAK